MHIIADFIYLVIKKHDEKITYALNIQLLSFYSRNM